VPPVIGNEYVVLSTLLLITTLATLVAATVRVLAPPLEMVAGVAEIVTVGEAAETVTVTEAVVLPPAPTAVIVYVVVCAGVTDV
jgi:hypothetical protein